MNGKSGPTRGVCGICGHQAAIHRDKGCAWPGCACAGMLAALTTREFDVLRRLAAGQTVKTIAGDLTLSTKTVEAHKYNIFCKTGVHSVLELALGALRSGAIQMDDLPELPVRIAAPVDQTTRCSDVMDIFTDGFPETR